MQEKNQILFLTIAEGKLYKAQKLLQKAALQDPCGVSYQNLGVFYAKEGLQLRSGRGRRADHLARHWLEKAMQINDTKGIRWALGYLALGQEQSLAALAQFQSAYRLFPEDWNSAYHCAVCCCRLHRDAEMLQWSRKMQPLADEEWREESLEMYAFALYLSDGDSSELRTLLQPDDVLSPWARFVLLAQLHDPAAVSLAESVWEHYALGMGEMAMLFAVTRPELAREYYFAERERLVEQHNSTARKELELLDTLFYDPAYRQSYLHQWRPSFPALWTDCYVDW